jgi:hypothetical protein
MLHGVSDGLPARRGFLRRRHAHLGLRPRLIVGVAIVGVANLDQRCSGPLEAAPARGEMLDRCHQNAREHLARQLDLLLGGIAPRHDGHASRLERTHEVRGLEILLRHVRFVRFVRFGRRRNSRPADLKWPAGVVPDPECRHHCVALFRFRHFSVVRRPARGRRTRRR